MVVCASQPSFRECLKPCAYRALRYRQLKCCLGVGAMVARQVHALVGPPRGFSATHELLPTLIQVVGAVLFGLAILHTFSTKYFEHLAHTQPGTRASGICWAR